MSPDEPNVSFSGPKSRLWTAALGIHVLLVLYMLVRDLDATAYDDSYFFKRFGLHAIEHGAFAWNVEDGPVHGSTSQLFQLVTTGIVAFTRTFFILGVKIFQALVLAVAGGCLIAWSRQWTRCPEDGAVLGLLLLDTPLVLTTVHTGMETALTLAVLVGVLIHAVRPGRPQMVAGLGAAAWTVSTYLARPDAAMLVAAWWGFMSLWERRFPWKYGLALVGGMAALLGLFDLYYGTPFPLSFYMKTDAFGYYDHAFVALSRPDKHRHAAVAALFALPPVWIAVSALPVLERSRRRSVVALLIAVFLFFSYHFWFTTEIMGYRARFYVPATVFVAALAVLSWDAFRTRASRLEHFALIVCWGALVAWGYRHGSIPNAKGFFLTTLPWPTYLGWWAALGTFMFASSRWPRVQMLGVSLALAGALVAWKSPRIPRLLNDAQFMRKHDSEVTTTRGIFDLARCLPQARTVYHSEMGVPGLVLPQARLVDFAGILSPETGLQSKTVAELCMRDRPDAIFLPHRVYHSLNDAFVESGCLRDYRRVVDKSSSPLHVRRDHAQTFLQCARDLHRWRSP